MKVFCIDGIIIETSHKPSRNDLEVQVFMPIEDQPIMAGLLRDRDISLLSPLTGSAFIDQFGGHMLEDINTETMQDVAEALHVPDTIPTDWP